MRKGWKLITPLAYRRPRRPGRRVALIAGGLALSTVVAGLGVLGSIGPTPRATPATHPRRSSVTMPTVTGSATAPASAMAIPTGAKALAGPRPTSATGTGAYPAPMLTPTITATSDAYPMTYDSGTAATTYPGGGRYHR